MTPEPSSAAPSAQPGAQPSGRQRPLPRGIEPMLAALGGQPLDSPPPLFEGEWDGGCAPPDPPGGPGPPRLRERLAAPDGDEAKRLAAGAPVTFQAFDIPYSRGGSVMDRPLWRRKLLLHRAPRPAGVP